MGCSSTNSIITENDSIIFKQLEPSLILNNNPYINISKIKSIINSIALLKTRFLLEYYKLINDSGCYGFTHPTINIIFRSILYKIATELKGDIELLDIIFNDDPPYLEIRASILPINTQKLIEELLNFIIEVKSYSTIIKQIEQDLPGILYILFEDNSKIDAEQKALLEDSLQVFDEVKKFRLKILSDYKNEIYNFITLNEKYVKESNKIGKYCFENNINEIDKIIYEANKQSLDLPAIEDEQGNTLLEVFKNIKDGKEIVLKQIEFMENKINKYKLLKSSTNSLNTISTG